VSNRTGIKRRRIAFGGATAIALLILVLTFVLTLTGAPSAEGASATSTQYQGWSSWWAPSSSTLSRALTGAACYQETNRNLVFDGSWRTARSLARSGGSATFARSAGASATLTFNGTGLTWIATTGPYCGKAQISLDGGTAVVVDLFSSRARNQRAVYSTGTLPSGTHTLQIAWTGQKNLLSKGNSVEIDALYVKGSLTKTLSTSGSRARSTMTTKLRPTTTTAVTTLATTAPTTIPDPTTTTVSVTTTTPAPVTTTTTTAPVTTTTTVRPTTTTVVRATTTTSAPTTTSTTTAPKAPAQPFNLQTAIDAAASGATITIPDGTYAGPFRIAGKSNLTLVGTAQAVLTVRGNDLLTISDSAGIVLQGFTMVGDYSLLGGKVVMVSGLRKGTFRDLTIRDAGNSGIYSNGVFTDITISGCKITHCGDFGVSFNAGGDNVLIENCLFSDFASLQYPGHGVYARSSNNVIVRNCEVSGVKTLSGYGDGGFQIAQCTNAQVIDCVSSGNQRYGFIVDGGVATFIRCRGQSNGVTDYYECGTTTRSIYTDCVGNFSKYPN
jgi:hypothetical protein